LYARHGGYHLAGDVGVLGSLGVAVGADVLDDTVLEGGGKLALVPCRKEEEKGVCVERGEGSAGHIRHNQIVTT
jgi:hypothetical protein